MITLRIKLYSILRKEYCRGNVYDAEKGIDFTYASPVSINKLCELLGIEAVKVAIVTINGRLCQEMNTLLQDGDEVGMHPQPPSGG